MLLIKIRSTYHCKSPSDTSCCWRAAPPAIAGWHSPKRRVIGGRSRRTCWPRTCPAHRWPRSHSRRRWSEWTRTRTRRSGRSRRCCAPGDDCPRFHARGRYPWSGASPANGLQCTERNSWEVKSEKIFLNISNWS